VSAAGGHPGGTIQGCAHLYGDDDDCHECGGDGKVGYRVGDDRPEAECPCCHGSGEHDARAYDEHHNGPRDAEPHCPAREHVPGMPNGRP